MQYRDRVRLDRYAIKDPDAELHIGDMVVASMQRVFERDNRTVESREIAYVEKQNPDGTYAVKLDGNDKIEDNIPRHRLEFVVEKSYADICHRIAIAAASVEKKHNRKKFAIALEEAMVAERLVAAGRILSGLGRPDYDLTLFNCYVFNVTDDSRGGISAHWGRLFETYSRGGGVGTPLSRLRPKGSVVRKVNGRSSGIITWAEQFSQITGAVEQGGSRQGALMLCLWCWHPDVLEFIDVKSKREEFKTPEGQIINRNRNLLYNANVSVLLSNDFMVAVEQDADWDLVFPDYRDPDYDSLWDGNLLKWRYTLGKPVEVYRTIKARDLWNRVIQRAWESGEPGIIFMDRANDLSNSWYYAPLIGGNPCAEALLPDNSVCNLAHINLSRYVTTQKLPTTQQSCNKAEQTFDWDLLEHDIALGIRLLDNVNDLNKYHDAAVKKQQLSERRIGLGILGYGDALIRLGLRYGSDEAVEFTDKLMRRFTTTAYRASCQLAKERGAFDKFQAKKFLASGFMRQMPEDIQKLVEKQGIRNVTVTIIAPTGSIAAMVNTSTGCEPFFDLEYTSTTRIGVVNEKAGVVDLVYQQFGQDPAKWPSYVVTAQHGITPEQHVRTQATMQRWIDAAISKTINAPSTATVKDVSDAYMLMWRLGCKGGTVYRDGSRDTQVLYTNQPKPTKMVSVEIVEESPETAMVRPRPDVGAGLTFSEESPIGTIHLTIRHDPETGEPIDVFVTTGKGDASADGEALGRLMSMILRFPNHATIPQAARLELIRNQLIDILGRGQVGYGPQAKRSLPDTIAKILNRYLEMDHPCANLPFGMQQLKDLFEEMRSYGGDKEKIDQLYRFVVKGEPRHEEPNGLTYQQEIEAEAQKAEITGIKLPYDYCPECGNFTLVMVPGKCPVCRTCGYTRC